MAQTSKHADDPTATPPDSSTVVLLLTTIGDTTWRMFGPTIGFASLGVYADNMLATKPWLTVVGIILGVIGAVLLIRNQFRNVKGS